MASNVERDLGAIFEKLQKMEAAAMEAKESRDSSSEKLDMALRELAATKLNVDRMMPMFNDITRWRQIALGSLMTIGALGAMIGVTLATAREFFLKMIGWH